MLLRLFSLFALGDQSLLQFAAHLCESFLEVRLLLLTFLTLTVNSLAYLLAIAVQLFGELIVLAVGIFTVLSHGLDNVRDFISHEKLHLIALLFAALCLLCQFRINIK